MSARDSLRAMAGSAYHHPTWIFPGAIDHMGHVGHSVYLEWVHEALVRYWESFAPPPAIARHLWVALSHEVKCPRPEPLDDVVGADVIAARFLPRD